MVVTFSRLYRMPSLRCGAPCTLVFAIGAVLLWLHALPALAQQSVEELGQRLRTEAPTAKTLDQQNQVLEKIERQRQSSTNEVLKKYLVSLQAWLLHQRGETYSQKAAETLEQGDAAASRDLDAKAMEDFDAAVRLDPRRWKSYHHRGVCYALQGKFQEALRDFSKTIELRPEYDKAWFNRGEVHYELGDFAKAIEDYDQAILLQADDAGFYTSRGNAYFQLRRFPQALADYGQAVSLDPENPEMYANRGDAYRAIRQWQKAADDFRQAIDLNSKFGRAYQSAAWLMATCPDPQFRNPELAVRAAERAIELDGSAAYIYLDTLAAALANSGQFERAQQVQRRAIETAPPKTSVRSNNASSSMACTSHTDSRPRRPPSALRSQRAVPEPLWLSATVPNGAVAGTGLQLPKCPLV